MKYTELTQDIVNKYFKDWIGVSIFNSEDPDKEPSCFGMDFLNFESAISSYEFLREWQNWLHELPLILSVVKENSSTYSFYIYKQYRREFVKATFSINLNINKLQIFIRNEQSRSFVILPRYADYNDNIVDSYTQNVIVFNGVKFLKREEITCGQIENN